MWRLFLGRGGGKCLVCENNAFPVCVPIKSFSNTFCHVGQQSVPQCWWHAPAFLYCLFSAIAFFQYVDFFSVAFIRFVPWSQRHGHCQILATGKWLLYYTTDHITCKTKFRVILPLGQFLWRIFCDIVRYLRFDGFPVLLYYFDFADHFHAIFFWGNGPH